MSNNTVKETREYIRKLIEKYSKIEIIKNEIKDLKDKLYRCNDIDFRNIGFKSSKSYRGIEDLIISCKDLIFIKETEIEIIEREFYKFELYLEQLTKYEKEVIQYRYINKNSNNNNFTINEVSNKTHQSIATVKRLDRSALMKISKMREENIVLNIA